MPNTPEISLSSQTDTRFVFKLYFLPSSEAQINAQTDTRFVFKQSARLEKRGFASLKPTQDLYLNNGITYKINSSQTSNRHKICI